MNTNTQTPATTPLEIVDVDLQRQAFLQFGSVTLASGEGLEVCIGIDPKSGAPMAVDQQTGLACIAPDWDLLFAALPHICREGMPHVAH